MKKIKLINIGNYGLNFLWQIPGLKNILESVEQFMTKKHDWQTLNKIFQCLTYKNALSNISDVSSKINTEH